MHTLELRRAACDESPPDGNVIANLIALADGTADEATVLQLRRTAWHWRLITLRALLGLLNGQPHLPGPLDAISDAWDLLARAQAAAEDLVNAVVAWPPVGTWAAHTIRRLTGRVTGDGPAWADVGYLHSLSAAAAIVAGLDFSLTIPVRGSWAVFPSLGCVPLPNAQQWDTARVDAVGHRIQVSCGSSTIVLSRTGGGVVSGNAWRPMPFIETVCDGRTLRVTMDDSDPYRNLRDPAAPNHIPDLTLARWRSTLDAAWQLLVQRHTEQATMIAAGLVSIAPLPKEPTFRPASASSEHGFGTILASEPEDAEQLAMTLIHEFDHNRLGALSLAVELHDTTGDRTLYAPWRDDPRHVGGAFQGVFAFMGITEFWRKQSGGPGAEQTNDLACFEFGLWRQQVDRTLRMIRDLPMLTEAGVRFVDAMLVRSRSWWDDRIPEHLRNLADIASGDHRALWLAFHRVPERSLVLEIARAWEAGADCPAIHPGLLARAPVIDCHEGRWLDARAVLMRLALMKNLTYENVDRCLERVKGATKADVHYAAGRLDDAQFLYMKALQDAPGDAVAWTGLRLTWPKVPAVLRNHPDLVRAVATTVYGTGAVKDPVGFVEWLDRGLLPT